MFPSIIAAPAGLCNCPGRGPARGAAAHRRDRRGQDRVGAADGSNPSHRFMQQAKPRVGAADVGGTAKPRHRRWTCAGAVLLDWSHSLIPVCFVGLFSPSCAFCRRMDRDSLRIFRFSVWTDPVLVLADSLLPAYTGNRSVKIFRFPVWSWWIPGSSWTPGPWRPGCLYRPLPELSSGPDHSLSFRRRAYMVYVFRRSSYNLSGAIRCCLAMSACFAVLLPGAGSLNRWGRNCWIGIYHWSELGS